MSVPPRLSGSGVALAAESRRCHPHPPTDSTDRCPLCDDPPEVAAAAIEIALDGDQITRHCFGCDARVRRFDWHGHDGLPIRYVGHVDGNGRFGGVYALYRTGAVKTVPGIDPDDHTRAVWPRTFDADELTRAVLAHLVGLDVAPHLSPTRPGPFCRFQPAGACGHAEWDLAIDDLTEWLEANR